MRVAQLLAVFVDLTVSHVPAAQPVNHVSQDSTLFHLHQPEGYALLVINARVHHSLTLTPTVPTVVSLPPSLLSV